MAEEIGPVDLRQSEEHPFLGREIAQPRTFSEEMSSWVDEAVSNLLRAAEERARQVIVDHETQIRQLVAKLEAEETINRENIEAILKPAAVNKGVA